MDSSRPRRPFFTETPYRTFRALQRASRELGFPRDQTFIEFEGSTITIPVRTTNLTADEVIEETLRLKAFMRLEVYPAYMNQQGTREFQFIIRDWELYEQSRSLNKVFMGSCDGREQGGATPSRHTVGVTFSLSKKYIKYHDPRHENLAPVEEVKPPANESEPHYVNEIRPNLVINNMSNQWNHHNDIVWQVQSHPGGAPGEFIVNFYRLPYERGAKYDPRNNFFDLVAQAGNGKIGLSANEEFIATGIPNRDNPPPPPHRVLEPLEIRWKIGTAPVADTFGVLHQIAPPQSFCVADQGPGPSQPDDAADFPARITYAASYDVWLNNQQILSDQAGVAMARNVQSIPPRDVLVAFEKPFSGEFTHLTSGDRIRIEFGSGTCTGMVEITRDDWATGRDLALQAQASALFL